MSLIVALALLSTPADAARPSKMQTVSCREMLMSSSRLGKIKVCKTRAEWRRWESCHSSVTRYCNPKKKTVQVTGLDPSEKLVCKYIKETGSRVGQQRMCATKREWELVELQTREDMRNLQSRGTLTGGSEEMSRNPVVPQ